MGEDADMNLYVSVGRGTVTGDAISSLVITNRQPPKTMAEVEALSAAIEEIQGWVNVTVLSWQEIAA